MLPGDEDALGAKVFLLVDSGSYEEALKLVEQPPLAPRLAFERVGGWLGGGGGGPESLWVRASASGEGSWVVM